MTAEKYAQENILRLQTLQFFPRQKMAQRELLKAFVKFCKTPEHIDETITHFAESSQNCPTPYEVKDFAHTQMWHLDASQRLAALRQKITCEKCDNTGKVPHEGNRTVNGVQRWASWLSPCDCEIGKLLNPRKENT